MGVGSTSMSKPSYWQDQLQQQLSLHRIPFHLYSLWLFTFTDLKTIVFPETCFGLLTALSQVNQQQQQQQDDKAATTAATTLAILSRTPLILFWAWMTLLPFAINNQSCSPEAIEEDRLNKPWRTMPSGRWTVKQAKRAMIFFYGASMLLSWRIGGLRSNIAMLGLGFWYNNLSGADSHPLIRNLINAFGFTAFGTGSLELALDTKLHFFSFSFSSPPSFTIFSSSFSSFSGVGNGPPSLEQWLLLVASVVLTTVHTQDMYDQQGDAERGRNTVPLYYGDLVARKSVVGFMVLWGGLLPWVWGCGWVGYGVCCGLAGTVAWRCWMYRGVAEDKATFRVWNLWMVVLYGLPLLRGF